MNSAVVSHSIGGHALEHLSPIALHALESREAKRTKDSITRPCNLKQTIISRTDEADLGRVIFPVGEIVGKLEPVEVDLAVG